MVNLLEWWKEASLLATFIWAVISNRKLNKIKEKKEDVSLSQMIQETYQRLNKDVFQRLDDLEKSNKDLTDKYNEMLLRNAILEERAESYEKKYVTLEKDYTKLKSDHDKLHKENKEIRKELDELKNNTV